MHTFCNRSLIKKYSIVPVLGHLNVVKNKMIKKMKIFAKFKVYCHRFVITLITDKKYFWHEKKN